MIVLFLQIVGNIIITIEDDDECFAKDLDISFKIDDFHFVFLLSPITKTSRCQVILVQEAATSMLFCIITEDRWVSVGIAVRGFTSLMLRESHKWDGSLLVKTLLVLQNRW